MFSGMHARNGLAATGKHVIFTVGMTSHCIPINRETLMVHVICVQTVMFPGNE